jgi:hypothetical protein
MRRQRVPNTAMSNDMEEGTSPPPSRTTRKQRVSIAARQTQRRHVERHGGKLFAIAAMSNDEASAQREGVDAHEEVDAKVNRGWVMEQMCSAPDILYIFSSIQCTYIHPRRDFSLGQQYIYSLYDSPVKGEEGGFKV